LTHQCRLPESGKTPEHDNVIETEAPFLVHSSQLSLAAEDVAIVLGEQTGQVNVWHLGCHLDLAQDIVAHEFGRGLVKGDAEENPITEARGALPMPPPSQPTSDVDRVIGFAKQLRECSRDGSKPGEL